MSTPTPTEQATIRALQGTIMNMDSLAQSGFSQINAIARLALLSLEAPEGHRSVDSIAYALAAISNIASEVEDCINLAAEEVGCDHVDEAWQRRAAASRVAKEAQ